MSFFTNSHLPDLNLKSIKIMSSARKFFIFLVIFFVAGVIQLQAQQESNCYVAVSVEDNDKATSSSDEEILGEVKIDMQFQNGIKKKLGRYCKGIRLPKYKRNDKGS